MAESRSRAISRTISRAISRALSRTMAAEGASARLLGGLVGWLDGGVSVRIAIFPSEQHVELLSGERGRMALFHFGRRQVVIDFDDIGRERSRLVGVVNNAKLRRAAVGSEGLACETARLACATTRLACATTRLACATTRITCATTRLACATARGRRLASGRALHLHGEVSRDDPNRHSRQTHAHRVKERIKLVDAFVVGDDQRRSFRAALAIVLLKPDQLRHRHQRMPDKLAGDLRVADGIEQGGRSIALGRDQDNGPAVLTQGVDRFWCRQSQVSAHSSIQI